MSTRIGYQGIVGSNSEKAAELLSASAKLVDYVLVPLLSSENVINALKNGDIDYGVVAVRNSTAGPVSETQSALQGGRFEVVESVTLRIKHSLFLLERQVLPDQVDEVRSHEQALRQCSGNLKYLLPNALNIPIEDTAIGASRLAKGDYRSNVAIVCAREIGESLGLYLFREGIEDSHDNRTEFVLVRVESLKSLQVFSDNIATKIMTKTVTRDTLSILTRVLVVITIFAGVLAKDLLGYTSLRAALSIGGAASGVFWLLTSNWVQNWLQFRTVKGYWRYNLFPDEDKPLVAQYHDVARVVCIDEGDTGLRIQGKLCKTPAIPWFESNQVLISPFGTKSGRLVYWYTNVHDATKESLFDGVVSLAWTKDHSNDLLLSMSGCYVGRTTGDIGVIKFERITKEDYEKSIDMKRIYS
jgi:prephenate dehydratase